VLDRESTFAHPQIVSLLKTKFVPVALDQAYQRRQKDAEGDYYRKLAGQGPRGDFRGTTQGFYVGTAGGKLLFYNNNRDPEKLLRLMQQSLKQFADLKATEADVAAIDPGKSDVQYNPTPPEGGLVVRVRAKVLSGYEATEDRWQKIFQNAISRDNLWVSVDEHQALCQGNVPRSLQMRIAKYHLVDNTRGEPPMWRDAEVRDVSMKLEDGLLTGQAHLETADGKRGFQVALRGHVVCKSDSIVRLDVIAKGEYWGEGQYTRNAPPGKFPLAVSFTLADGTDVADRIPPQGSRGWVRGYLR